MPADRIGDMGMTFSPTPADAAPRDTRRGPPSSGSVLARVCCVRCVATRWPHGLGLAAARAARAPPRFTACPTRSADKPAVLSHVHAVA